MRATLVWIIALFAALSWVVCWEELQIVRLRNHTSALAAQLRASEGQAQELRTRLEADEKLQLRGAEQLVALARLQEEATAARLRRDQDSPAVARKDLRRIILGQYREALAGLSLPPESLARLKDLLTARGEALLDAHEAAAREGLADGSPEMAEALNQASADLDREIAKLLGDEAYRKLRGSGVPQKSQPEASPAPAGR